MEVIKKLLGIESKNILNPESKNIFRARSKFQVIS